jgi:hypothetical protein
VLTVQTNVHVRNTVKRSRSAFDAHKNPHTLVTSPSEQVKSQKMEMNMAAVEERKYEVSEEAEEIDESFTDRDTIMGNSATKFVKHKKEEPEKKLVVVKYHMCGLDRVRSMDGDTFRVVHDTEKKCINIMFDQEMTEPGNKKWCQDNNGGQMAAEVHTYKLHSRSGGSTLQDPRSHTKRCNCIHRTPQGFCPR